jgi:hypothetical protein
MLIKEYRIPLPLTVEEYRIGKHSAKYFGTKETKCISKRENSLRTKALMK